MKTFTVSFDFQVADDAPKVEVIGYLKDAILSWGGQYHPEDWRRDEMKLQKFQVKRKAPL